jgi:hypothetical protein
MAGFVLASLKTGVANAQYILWNNARAEATRSQIRATISILDIAYQVVAKGGNVQLLSCICRASRTVCIVFIVDR